MADSLERLAAEAASIPKLPAHVIERKPEHPGSSILEASYVVDGDLWSVMVQDYGVLSRDRYRVAEFSPGQPKMCDTGWEPNWTQWTNDLEDAKTKMAGRCCAIEKLTIGAVAYDPRQQQPLLPRRTVSGREWLATLGRPIVEGDPINDFRIPAEHVDWAAAPRAMRDALARPLPPGFTDPLADLARLLCQDDPFIEKRPRPDWLATSDRERVSEALTGIRKVIETYGGGDQAIGPREARSAFAKIDALAVAALQVVKP